MARVKQTPEEKAEAAAARKIAGVDKLENFFKSERAHKNLEQTALYTKRGAEGVSDEQRKANYGAYLDSSKERGADERARLEASTGKKTMVMKEDLDKRNVYRAAQSSIDDNGNLLVYIRPAALEQAKGLHDHLSAGGKIKDFKPVDKEGKPTEVTAVASLLAYNENAIASNGNDKGDFKLSDINLEEGKKVLRIGVSPEVLIANAKENGNATKLLDVVQSVSDYTKGMRMDTEVSRRNSKIREASKSKEGGKEV